MRKISFIICGTVFLLALGLKADVKIDLNNAVICTSGKEKNAAEELQKHLELIGGISVPIVAHPASGKYVFRVGGCPEGVKQDFALEEAVWEVRKDAAYFYGDHNGVKNAVYAFLEDELGVRWPSGDDIAYTPQNPLVMKKTYGQWIPQFRIRYIRSPQSEELWRIRMRRGWYQAPSYGHAFTDWWKRYGKEHPEYFAMNYGMRTPVNRTSNISDPAASNGRSAELVALCVSNDAVVDRIIENWDKKSEYIRAIENDAYGKHSCHCAKCRELDAIGEKESWDYNLADRYVNFANRIAAKAVQYRSDAKVTLAAYNASQWAPRREKLAPNIVMIITPTDFRKTELEKFVNDWKKAGMKAFVYRPNRHHYYNATLLPCGFEKYFYDIFQFMVKSGAVAFDYDANNCEPLEWFGDYILQKAMQDPEKSFEYWEKHYAQAFGEAGNEVIAYYEYWRREVWEKRLFPALDRLASKDDYHNFSRSLMRNLKTYYRLSDFDAGSQILEKALKKNLTPAERKRVQNLIQANTHARLVFQAVTNKNDAASIALMNYRLQHGLPLINSNEQYWGDICGIKRVMNLREFTPPYLETPLFWAFRPDPENIGIRDGWFKAGKKIYEWGDYMPTNNFWEKPYSHYKYPSESTRKLMRNYDGVAWYGCSLKIPEKWQGREIYLYFGAVDESAWIYINGDEAGQHLFRKPEDWTVPFTINITGRIRWSNSEQYVIVRVEDRNGFGGIWKRVMLVSKDKTNSKKGEK